MEQSRNATVTKPLGTQGREGWEPGRVLPKIEFLLLAMTLLSQLRSWAPGLREGSWLLSYALDLESVGHASDGD